MENFKYQVGQIIWLKPKHECKEIHHMYIDQYFDKPLKITSRFIRFDLNCYHVNNKGWLYIEEQWIYLNTKEKIQNILKR